jgi:hypothetical protein
MARSLKRIHVNQHIIRRNKAEGRTDPPLTVKQGKSNTYAQSVEILGPSKLVYALHEGRKPLSCGATIWIETYSDLVIEGGVEAAEVCGIG